MDPHGIWKVVPKSYSRVFKLWSVLFWSGRTSRWQFWNWALFSGCHFCEVLQSNSLACPRFKHKKPCQSRSRDDENQGFHLGKKIEEDSLKVVAHYTVPLDGKSFEERLSWAFIFKIHLQNIFEFRVDLFIFFRLLCDILLNERSRQSSEWVKKENFSISLSSIHELVRSNKLRPTYEDLRCPISKAPLQSE